MDLKERLRRRTRQFRNYRPQSVSPTVTIRKELPGDALGHADPVGRLVVLCRAVASSLRRHPRFSSSYDGHLGLGSSPAPTLRIGLEGGARWAVVGDADRLGPGLLAALQQASADDNDSQSRPCLEILDLSGLGVCDWRGVVAAPLVARLVVLAPTLQAGTAGGVSAVEALPLLLDFDNRLADAAAAAGFLDEVAKELAQPGESAS